jgi:LPS O-antigen subunit length determinant protein (WzzB/FepE family)
MPTTNTFNSMLPNFKEQYSDENDKKKRFKRLRAALKSNGKANAELKASKDPQKFLADKSYLNLKGKKGVAV